VTSLLRVLEEEPVVDVAVNVILASLGSLSVEDLIFTKDDVFGSERP